MSTLNFFFVLWQVRCCAHRTRRSCQKYDEVFFSNFVAFSENPNFNTLVTTYACKLKSEIVMWRRFQNHNPLCCYVTVRWLLWASMLIFSGGLLWGPLLMLMACNHYVIRNNFQSIWLHDFLNSDVNGHLKIELYKSFWLSFPSFKRLTCDILLHAKGCTFVWTVKRLFTTYVTY